jgi:uncharacterized membrane protein YbaN (DUF454 family)
MKGHPIKQYAFLVLGTLSLVIGMIGVVIPVLPTTPLLLMASFFYLRSSKRMYNWLITHKIFGSYIYCYVTYHAISPRTKVGALIFLWATLVFSMVVIPGLHIKLFLVVVGMAVTTHIILLKTLSPKEMNEMRLLDGNEIEEVA